MVNLTVPSTMDAKYDSALLGILQHEGKIDKFLHIMLGFLYRRTDFYRIMKSKEDKLGFPAGVAPRMLLSIYKEYEELATKAEEQRQQLMKPKSTDVEPTPSQESKQKESKSSSESQTQPNLAAKAPVVEQTDNSHVQCRNGQGDKGHTMAATDSAEGEAATTDVVATSEGAQGDKRSGEEDDNPELTRQQKLFQEDPESYNGAVRDNYCWSQSITDLDLTVKVPEHIRKGRDVKVDIDKKHVRVQHKGDQGQWVEVVDGDLIWDVHKDETIWSLVPGKHVQISLDKKEERWWEALLTDEPKISVRKIDASRPMTDLDQEAQAKIEEMMYNDRQKKLGKPTSQEKNVHEMLRTAWDAEGSPFKNQPFDPSKISVDPSGVVNMKPT